MEAAEYREQTIDDVLCLRGHLRRAIRDRGCRTIQDLFEAVDGCDPKLWPGVGRSGYRDLMGVLRILNSVRAS